MPSNLKDYMSKNNITNSSKGSFEFRREEDRQSERSQGNKFAQSKSQCITELTQILAELDKKEMEMRKMADVHNSQVVKRFIEEYDTIAQQIIHQVENYLRTSKQRYLQEIKERRASQMAQCKPIRRNIDKFREEVISLREGLYRQNQYRQYISKIVLKDFTNELNYIQTDINRIRFPTIDIALDDKYYSCMKSDLEKLTILKDELIGRGSDYYTSKSVSQQSGKLQEINPHANRDFIKRKGMNHYS